MVQRLAAVAVSVWDRTQTHVKCDWKRHWLTRERVQVQSEREADRSLRPGSRSRVFIIPSFCADANTKPSARADGFKDGVGSTRRTQRAQRARPSETPTSEISGRQVVKARPASPPMIVQMAEGSRTNVLSAPVSFSKDEMTTGGLFVIDGIDVVATLVPEEDVWQIEATKTCTTETQMQDREQESIAVVDYEDPSTTEAIEAHDARTGEVIDSEEVRKGRAKEVRELDEFEVKMMVDESEMRVIPGEKI